MSRSRTTLEYVYDTVKKVTAYNYYNEVIYALAPTNHIVVSVLKYAVLE